ncbi:uncharacterized protein [Nothobranchius furzeri]|uniref:Transcript variant X2 n=1 Tax=Nothobranchius furzeri TaxID=105023 RepID=A0A9D3C4I1_NOTFU|nr:transcript variant X2 [Nothobranchius furzeri]
MAAVCVQAELRLRDGQNRTVGVVVGNGLSALRSGISELNAKVSQILTELVDRERPRGGCTRVDEDEDSDEDEDFKDTLEPQPAPKKSKTTQNS